MKILKGDIVYIRSGKDSADAKDKKTVRGKVLRAMPKEGKVLVEGINMVTKRQKPGAQSGAGQVQQGGRIQMEAALPVSRVMLVCPHCDKLTRVGMSVVEETRQTLHGDKTVQARHRMCKQCGQEIVTPDEARRV